MSNNENNLQQNNYQGSNDNYLDESAQSPESYPDEYANE